MTSGTLELRADDPLDACFLAEGRLDEGDLEGAMRRIVRTTRRFPEFGLAWSHRARFSILAGRPRNAMKAAKKAIDLMPGSAVPWEHMGDALALLDCTGKAIECWDHALSLGNHPRRGAVQEKIDDLLGGLVGDTYSGFHNEETGEFWAIKVRGQKSVVRFGEVGQKGRKRVREFSSESAARRNAERLIAEKLREGFSKVESAQD